ncbi:hypothetical protein PHO31112_02181 [Pandoraea horticolens]|uniref:Uncharacterized protein n=1 Tax=Pandoraea horticolens TaxID=2508298 RepID=A0A5E4UPU6_9BURK|nr:hypothetical protein PHO31112_02181 [Pandoraea horticolens]
MAPTFLWTHLFNDVFADEIDSLPLVNIHGFSLKEFRVFR